MLLLLAQSISAYSNENQMFADWSISHIKPRDRREQRTNSRIPCLSRDKEIVDGKKCPAEDNDIENTAHF